jgi:GR25 family glycosyltransferase involved in LPS biosynthesis
VLPVQGGGPYHAVRLEDTFLAQGRRCYQFGKRKPQSSVDDIQVRIHTMVGGLLDRSTARYFYKGSKTSLQRHTGNLVGNLFSKKMCIYKLFTTFDRKVLVSINNNTLNGLLLNKIALL